MYFHFRLGWTMYLLLLPFHLASQLWQWAAPAVPDPGLRYVALFILPQVALNHAVGLVLSLSGAATSELVSSLLTVCCCCCIPMIVLGWDFESKKDPLPEFEWQEQEPKE